LNTNAQLTAASNPVPSGTQIVSALLLCLFLACVGLTGFGQHLWIVAIPFGLASMLISSIRCRCTPGLSAYELAIVPFDSIGQIRTALESAPQFRKRRYRPELESRTIRTKGSAFLLSVQMFLTQTMYGPLLLVFWLFPLRAWRFRVTFDPAARF
jgi:hypothetical protein